MGSGTLGQVISHEVLTKLETGRTGGRHLVDHLVHPAHSSVAQVAPGTVQSPKDPVTELKDLPGDWTQQVP